MFTVPFAYFRFPLVTRSQTIETKGGIMPTTEELLIAETDGACSYCGIKDYRVLTTHHIIQKEPKDEGYDNKILLCHNCHHLYHNNKGPSLQDLLDIKKRLICKVLTQQGINSMKGSYRQGMVAGTPFLLNHLVELQLLELVDVISTIDGSSGVDIVMEASYQLTTKGRQLLEKWDIK